MRDDCSRSDGGWVCVAGGGWFNWRCGWLLLQRENRRICVAPSGSARRITSDLEKEHWSLPGVDGRGDALLTNARLGLRSAADRKREKTEALWVCGTSSSKCDPGVLKETQWVTLDWTKRWWTKIWELKIHAWCKVTGQIVLSHHWDLTWCYGDRETIRAPQSLSK